MNCLSCSKPIANTAKFCNFCGANQLELKAKADEEIIKKGDETKKAQKAKIVKIRDYALAALVGLGIIGGVYFGFSEQQGDNLAEIKTPPLASNSSSTYVQELIKSSIQNYQLSMDCYVDTYTLNDRQQRYCVKVSEVYDSNQAGDQYIYATLSGISVDDNNQPEQYRASAGLIGLLKFKKEGNIYKLVANTLVLSGSFGKPGEAKIIPLGSNNIGWVLANNYAGMGNYSSYLTFFSASNNKIHEVLKIAPNFNNKDACDPDNKSCTFQTIKFDVRQNKNQDPFYPIKIYGSVVTGTLGKSVKETKGYVITYDPKKGVYNVPAEFANLIQN